MAEGGGAESPVGDVGRGVPGAVDVPAQPAGPRWLRALLGPDRPMDLALVVATFAIFFVLDRLTRSLAVLERADLDRVSLTLAAVGGRWWIVAVLGAVAIGLAVRWPRRLVIRWGELEAGTTLRLLAGALVVLIMWQDVLYRQNWLTDRTHLLDRGLILVLGVAALARPVFLVAFVAVARIVAEQFAIPFDTSAGRNVGDLLLMALLAVAAGHLVHVATGDRRTSPILLVLSSALAAHFFIPGKGKVSIGWWEEGRIADLPLSSHTVGWLGQTDGGWAEALWSFYDQFRWPVMIATLVLEVGAIVAVTRPRLLRWWLPGCVAFHVVTFATTGFWFLSWIVLELVLLAILVVPSRRSWVAPNATPARGLVAAVAVLGGSILFHPPGLAWLDAPVSYGYRIDATGAGGDQYHVSVGELAPLSQHITFNRVQLGSVHGSGAYGATVSAEVLDELDSIDTFDELDAYEAALGQTSEAPSIDFLSAFLDYAAQPRDSWSERALRRLAPPEYFWTGAPEPTYRFQEPLRTLEVIVVRSIHRDGEPETQSRSLVTLVVGPDGEVVVAE